MICPIDKSDMIVVEHESIELDYCLKCKGVWFDSGELELLVSLFKSKGDGSPDQDILAQKPAISNEALRKCPICGHKMDKVLIGNKPEVLIDSCPQGDGLWFDGGELHQVLCQIKTTGQGVSGKDIISFLGETFRADCK